MVIRTLHRLFHHLKSLLVAPAESNLRRIHKDQLVRGAGPADGAHLTVNAPFGKLRFPKSRVRHQRTISRRTEAFGNGKNRDGRIKLSQNLLEKPVYTERGDAANHEIGALDDFFPVFEIVELDVVREGAAEFLVLAGPDVSVDDPVVEASPDDMHFVAVLRGRKSQGRSHHPRSDNRDLSFHPSIN